MTYTKYEDIPENKEMFVYGFKQVKTDKIDNYILFGCESDELFENDKLFNFWSNKFISKEIEMRDFKTTRSFFMTIVKRNNFFKFQGLCIKLKKHQPNQKPDSFHFKHLNFILKRIFYFNKSLYYK